MFKTANLKLDQLVLDPLNPRFTTRENKNFSESETIDYLIEYEELLTLAKQINDYGGLTPGERIIVMEEKGEYVVLEGNRRTAALKLLNNPSLSKLKKKIPKITKECADFIKSIPVDIVESREAADKALVTRHIEGIRVWSQFSKMKFYKRMFDNGKTLDEISMISPESKLAIKKELHRYSILINILDNYARFTKSDSFISTAVDTKLPTDLLLTRLYSYYTDKNGLNLKFDKHSYELLLPDNEELRDLILHILVLIAKMYWEEEVIDTRILNTKKEIYNFFQGKDINDKIKFPINQTHRDLVELVKLYNNLKSSDNLKLPDKKEKSPNESNNDSDEKNKQDNQIEKQNKSKESNDNDVSTDNNEQSSNLDLPSNNTQQTSKSDKSDDNPVDEKNHENFDNNKPKINNNRGRKRNEPKDYDYLLDAYPFKNRYRENNRINQTLKELSKIPYKECGLSANFLIRSLLESYAYEYMMTFNNKHPQDPHKLKGLTVKNFFNKELNAIYTQYLADHIGNYDEKYTTVKERIISLFDKSNNLSITYKLNQFVHSPDFNPTFRENLENWENVCFILTAMDEIIHSAGQN